MLEKDAYNTHFLYIPCTSLTFIITLLFYVTRALVQHHCRFCLVFPLPCSPSDELYYPVGCVSEAFHAVV